MAKPGLTAESPRRLVWSLAAPAIVLVGAVLLVPLLRVAFLAFVNEAGQIGISNFATVIGSPVERHAFLTTLELSFLTLLVCALLGTPYAFIMCVVPPRVAGLLMLAVTLPFWTALLVRTYIWLIILQRHGLANVLLAHLGLERTPLALVNNFTGTAIGMIHIMLPVFILPTYAAMRAIDPELVRAAVSLGASRLRAFVTVVLPLAKGGIYSGAALVFVVSLGFFVTPAILGGGNVYVISNRIERNISSYGDWGTASALGLLLLLIVGAVLAAAYALTARSVAQRVVRDV